MTADERKARRREISATYRERHLEKERARGRACSKKWHAAHRAESIAASKAHYSKHRLKRLAQARAKALLPNRESGLAARRAQWVKQREERNAQRRRRRIANLMAARQRDAERRARPGYSEQATARTAEWVRAHPEWARALGRKRDSKRRALELSAFVEDIDPRVVFERDKGQCGICMQPVDVKSKWHVDHIVPISKGGPHAYANVQLAHAKCNRVKAARL